MSESDSPQADSWTVSYWDQSGNGFRFWQTPDGEARFVYDPVTPERSSSGTYSGGSPHQGTLEPDQIEALFVRVRELEANTGGHTSRREMGTGMFRVRECGAERRFIVRNGSARKAFESFISRFRKL